CRPPRRGPAPEGGPRASSPATPGGTGSHSGNRNAGRSSRRSAASWPVRGRSAWGGPLLRVRRLALLPEELLQVVVPARRLVRHRARLPPAEGLHPDDGAGRG